MKIAHRGLVPALCLAVASAGMVSCASASPVTASDLLNGYSLIVLGNTTSTSEVDGKAYVGGNLSGGNYDIHNVSAGAGINALTVGGNLTGNVNVNGPGVAIGGNLATQNYSGNGGGNAYIGGSWTGSANFNLNGSGNVYLGGTKTGSGNVNGGTLYQNQPSGSLNVPTSSTTSAIQNTLKNYSSYLQGLETNNSVVISGNTATFKATSVNASGLAVFDITASQLASSSIGQIQFNANGAKGMIINVLGLNAGTLNIAANFLGGSAQWAAQNVLWNFGDATGTIDINSQFGGDVLAYSADVLLNQNLEGTLVAGSLTQGAEIHFDGTNPNLPVDNVMPTPLPASWTMFAAALGLMGFAAFRRKKAWAPDTLRQAA